ncbi:MAG: hypothetical protein RSH07_05855 [Comamonas sp.]
MTAPFGLRSFFCLPAPQPLAREKSPDSAHASDQGAALITFWAYSESNSAAWKGSSHLATKSPSYIGDKSLIRKTPLAHTQQASTAIKNKKAHQFYN